jgi:hypothetical protein
VDDEEILSWSARGRERIHLRFLATTSRHRVSALKALEGDAEWGESVEPTTARDDSIWRSGHSAVLMRSGRVRDHRRGTWW